MVGCISSKTRGCRARPASGAEGVSLNQLIVYLLASGEHAPLAPKSLCGHADFHTIMTQLFMDEA